MLADALVLDVGRQWLTSNQCSGGAGQRGGHLDAVSTLPCEPEKTRRVHIVTCDGRTIRNEAAQSGPAVPHPVDSRAGRVLEPVHRDGDVDVVGKCVAGSHRVFVGWRQQQLAGVRLEIKLFFDVDDHRPPRDSVPRRCGQQDGGPAQWLQPDRPHPGLQRHLVGPGAGGVHQHGRRKCSDAGANLPRVACALDPGFAGARHQLHSRMPAQLQVTEVNRRDIHVVTGLVKQATRDPVVTEQRALFTRLRRIERPAAVRRRISIEHRCERKESRRISNDQHATRTEQRCSGKSGRRTFEEIAAGPRQRTDRRVAVGLDEHRGRPPGGMQSGLVFRLEQDDATARGQLGGDGGAGHACAQHDHVCVFQGTTVGDASGNRR
jgi:hypothetical protein